MVRILSEQFCGSKYDSCHYFVFFISPHTHQKAPRIQFFSAPPQEPARKRNHLCPDTHTDPSPVNTNTHINKEVSSLAVYQLLRLTFSRNLRLCAAASGYCRRAWRVEFSLRKCSCMIRPKGSHGWICSYKTKSDWGKSFAAHLMTLSDLREALKQTFIR